MKKILLALFLLTSGVCLKAQEIGLRFGNVFVNDVAIDGIFSMGEFSRVHADFSIGHGISIDALYDFLYKPLGTEGLHWYVGAGPFLAFTSNGYGDDDDSFWFGATGEIGLEYKFTEAPIVLGLDWRPYIPFVQRTDFFGEGWGFNVRYVIR